MYAEELLADDDSREWNAVWCPSGCLLLAKGEGREGAADRSAKRGNVSTGLKPHRSEPSYLQVASFCLFQARYGHDHDRRLAYCALGRSRSYPQTPANASGFRTYGIRLKREEGRRVSDQGL